MSGLVGMVEAARLAAGLAHAGFALAIAGLLCVLAARGAFRRGSAAWWLLLAALILVAVWAAAEIAAAAGVQAWRGVAGLE